LTNVSKATIGTIVATLVDDDLVCELADRVMPSTAGRPPRALWFTPSAGLSIGLAVHDLMVEGVLVNARRDLVAQTWTEVSEAKDKAATQKAIAATALELSRAADHQPVGIGVAIPGVVDRATSTVRQVASWPSLEGTWLGDAFDDLKIDRHFVANDALVEALAEQQFGTAGYGPFVALHVGDGIGAGYALEEGAAVRVSELGHTTVDRGGLPCRCGASGCWETIASLRWLRAEGASRGVADSQTLDVVSIEARSIVDPEVRRLRSDWITNLAIGIANAVQWLGPTTFVLQGDLARASGEFISDLVTETRERCLPHHRGDITIVASTLGARATAIGAACLVLTEFFQAGGQLLNGELALASPKDS
jgi:predicted NBD/HSP70 family sugar kinase